MSNEVEALRRQLAETEARAAVAETRAAAAEAANSLGDEVN